MQINMIRGGFSVKIAFSNLACPEWSMEEVFTHATEFGFDGVEIRLLDGNVIPPNLDGTTRRRIVQLAKESNIEIVGLGASTGFAMEDEAQREQNVEELLRYLELAAQMGVSMVRTFGGGSNVGNSVKRANAVQYVANALACVAPRAEGLGVSVLLETHDEFSHSAMVRDVVEKVNSPAVGALWDTHHPYRMGETIEETYSNLQRALKHVHLKDARRNGDSWNLVVFDEGEVPVREIVRKLVDEGYDRYLCIEWERKWHPEIESAGTALPKHMRILKQYLNR